jgi:hypothetical protein
MIASLYSALKRRRCGRAITSESGRACRASDGEAPAALPASLLRSEAANAAEEVLVLLVLIKMRFLSPPYSNCPGSTCLTHLGTEGGLLHQSEFLGRHEPFGGGIRPKLHLKTRFIIVSHSHDSPNALFVFDRHEIVNAHSLIFL